MAIFHLTQRTSILPLSALNTDRKPSNCTEFFIVTYFILRSTYFQPPTHKGPSENSLICSTPHVCDQVCEVAGEVELSTLSNGSLEMKSLTLQVSVNWHLRRCLRTFQQGLNDNGTEFKDSVPSNQSPFGRILLLL